MGCVQFSSQAGFPHVAPPVKCSLSMGCTVFCCWIVHALGKCSLKERLIPWGDLNKMDGFLFIWSPSAESLCFCRVGLRADVIRDTSLWVPMILNHSDGLWIKGQVDEWRCHQEQYPVVQCRGGTTDTFRCLERLHSCSSRQCPHCKLQGVWLAEMQSRRSHLSSCLCWFPMESVAGLFGRQRHFGFLEESQQVGLTDHTSKQGKGLGAPRVGQSGGSAW